MDKAIVSPANKKLKPSPKSSPKPSPKAAPPPRTYIIEESKYVGANPQRKRTRSLHKHSHEIRKSLPDFERMRRDVLLSGNLISNALVHVKPWQSKRPEFYYDLEDSNVDCMKKKSAAWKLALKRVSQAKEQDQIEAALYATLQEEAEEEAEKLERTARANAKRILKELLEENKDENDNEGGEEEDGEEEEGEEDEGEEEQGAEEQGEEEEGEEEEGEEEQGEEEEGEDEEEGAKVQAENEVTELPQRPRPLQTSPLLAYHMTGGKKQATA